MKHGFFIVLMKLDLIAVGVLYGKLEGSISSAATDGDVIAGLAKLCGNALDRGYLKTQVAIKPALCNGVGLIKKLKKRAVVAGQEDAVYRAFLGAKFVDDPASEQIAVKPDRPT